VAVKQDLHSIPARFACRWRWRQ